MINIKDKVVKEYLYLGVHGKDLADCGRKIDAFCEENGYKKEFKLLHIIGREGEGIIADVFVYKILEGGMGGF